MQGLGSNPDHHNKKKQCLIGYIETYDRALVPNLFSSFSLPNIVNCSHHDYRIDVLIVAVRALALPSSSFDYISDGNEKRRNF